MLASHESLSSKEEEEIGAGGIPGKTSAAPHDQGETEGRTDGRGKGSTSCLRDPLLLLTLWLSLSLFLSRGKLFRVSFWGPRALLSSSPGPRRKEEREARRDGEREVIQTVRKEWRKGRTIFQQFVILCHAISFFLFLRKHSVYFKFILKCN